MNKNAKEFFYYMLNECNSICAFVYHEYINGEKELKEACEQIQTHTWQMLDRIDGFLQYTRHTGELSAPEMLEFWRIALNKTSNLRIEYIKKLK